MDERPVLITTAHRLVVFGYATDTSGFSVRLRRARICLYWPPELKGYMGLAALGPDSRCRVGPPADGEWRDVTSVLEVVPAAVQKWEAAPWAGEETVGPV